MATKPMKAAGVKGKGGDDRRASGTQRSPLAPTSTKGGPSGLPFDDASAKVMKGELRTRGVAGLGVSDGALGQKGPVSRRATTAGAQYRITSALPAPVAPEARATQANGRILPSVMGTKQFGNFNDDMTFVRGL